MQAPLEAFLQARRTKEGLTKSDVGLDQVDNTPDASKPVSTAQEAAIDAAIDEAVDEAVAAAQVAIDALQATVTAALLLKANIDHTHSISQVVGLSDALSGLSIAAAGKVAKAGDTMTGPLVLPTYLKAALPDAATYARSMVHVSDLTGGAEFCYSDGTSWRRMSDRSLVN